MYAHVEFDEFGDGQLSATWVKTVEEAREEVRSLREAGDKLARWYFCLGVPYCDVCNAGADMHAELLAEIRGY